MISDSLAIVIKTNDGVKVANAKFAPRKERPTVLAKQALEKPHKFWKLVANPGLAD